MKHTIMCYQHASADYILDIINILILNNDNKKDEFYDNYLHYKGYYIKHEIKNKKINV